MSRDKNDLEAGQLAMAPQKSWRPPTRRAFVAMLGAAAAAVVVREAKKVEEPNDPPRSPWAGTTRWIGHC